MANHVAHSARITLTTEQPNQTHALSVARSPLNADRVITVGIFLALEK